MRQLINILLCSFCIPLYGLAVYLIKPVNYSASLAEKVTNVLFPEILFADNCSHSNHAIQSAENSLYIYRASKAETRVHFYSINTIDLNYCTHNYKNELEPLDLFVDENYDKFKPNHLVLNLLGEEVFYRDVSEYEGLYKLKFLLKLWSLCAGLFLCQVLRILYVPYLDIYGGNIVFATLAFAVALFKGNWQPPEIPYELVSIDDDTFDISDDENQDASTSTAPRAQSALPSSAKKSPARPSTGRAQTAPARPPTQQGLFDPRDQQGPSSSPTQRGSSSPTGGKHEQPTAENQPAQPGTSNEPATSSSSNQSSSPQQPGSSTPDTTSSPSRRQRASSGPISQQDSPRRFGQQGLFSQYGRKGRSASSSGSPPRHDESTPSSPVSRGRRSAAPSPPDSHPTLPIPPTSCGTTGHPGRTDQRGSSTPPIPVYELGLSTPVYQPGPSAPLPPGNPTICNQGELLQLYADPTVQDPAQPDQPSENIWVSSSEIQDDDPVGPVIHSTGGEDQSTQHQLGPGMKTPVNSGANVKEQSNSEEINKSGSDKSSNGDTRGQKNLASGEQQPEEGEEEKIKSTARRETTMSEKQEEEKKPEEEAKLKAEEAAKMQPEEEEEEEEEECNSDGSGSSNAKNKGKRKQKESIDPKQQDPVEHKGFWSVDPESDSKKSSKSQSSLFDEPKEPASKPKTSADPTWIKPSSSSGSFYRPNINPLTRAKATTAAITLGATVSTATGRQSASSGVSSNAEQHASRTQLLGLLRRQGSSASGKSSKKSSGSSRSSFSSAPLSPSTVGPRRASTDNASIAPIEELEEKEEAEKEKPSAT